MNHDELLAKIEDIRINYLPETTSELAWEKLADTTRALRTVVELHKPVTPKEGMFKNQKFCSKCERMFYPCPTIRAIEKELK